MPVILEGIRDGGIGEELNRWSQLVGDKLVSQKKQGHI